MFDALKQRSASARVGAADREPPAAARPEVRFDRRAPPAAVHRSATAPQHLTEPVCETCAVGAISAALKW
jgi:hypothetical protein